MSIGDLVPEGLRRVLSPYWWRWRVPLNGRESLRRIPRLADERALEAANRCLLVGVGPNYDQRVPNATMNVRAGYCHAAESIGLPWMICDVRGVAEVAARLTNPILFLLGADFEFLGARACRALRPYRKAVWVDPWFEGSDRFFSAHGLDARTWTWRDGLRRRILESHPTIAFTGTVKRGLEFFSSWRKEGVRVESLPLACDESLYNDLGPPDGRFKGVKMAFVGGYWPSKGVELDRHLRAFEDDLEIYGYSRWPYRGYRGPLPRNAEPQLYRQATVSPTINEPSVRLMHGQINERVFKVLGSGGVTVVDAVPAYRDLFEEEELLVPRDVCEFQEFVRALLRDSALRERYRAAGREAVRRRHTYGARIRQLFEALGETVTPQSEGM